MGITNSPLHRRCGAEDESSPHTPCKYEALASRRQVHLRSFFLDAEDIKSFKSGGHLEL